MMDPNEINHAINAAIRKERERLLRRLARRLWGVKPGEPIDDLPPEDMLLSQVDNLREVAEGRKQGWERCAAELTRERKINDALLKGRQGGRPCRKG